MIVFKEVSSVSNYVESDVKTRIVELLEYVKSNPKMYLPDPDDRNAFDRFIDGFTLGLFACGIQMPSAISNEVIEERGREINSRGQDEQIREKGLTDEEIFEENYEMMLETWRRYEPGSG